MLSTLFSPLRGCTGIECVKAYVNLPDPSYGWYDTGVRLNGVDETSSVSWTGYVLNMTSQTWLTAEDVSHPLWWHILVVIIPSNLDTTDWANVIIESGVDNRELGIVEHVSNRRPPDENITHHRNRTFWSHLQIDGNDLMDMIPVLQKGVYKSAYLATHTRSVGASFFSSLNDYQVYTNDPEQMYRTDDDIKHRSWVDYLKHGGMEPERIMEMPVAKAGARALDTVAEFTAQLPSGKVNRFGVAGFSKYGHGVFLLGAIGDERIKAIAPEAMPPDMGGISALALNGFRQDAAHFVGLLSQGSSINQESARPELMSRDYTVDLHPTIREDRNESFPVGHRYEKVFKAMPAHLLESFNLVQMIDPFWFLQRITVPMLYVMDTNDEWFGSSSPRIQSWLSKLSGPADLAFVEAEHETVLSKSMSPISAFFRGNILGESMPEIETKFEDHKISVTQRSGPAPSSVRLHFATSCKQKGPTSSIQRSAKNTFRYSNWYRGGEIEEEKPGSRSWVAELNAPEVALFKTGVGDCEDKERRAKGAFVVLEFPGPQPGYDNYQISTYFYEYLSPLLP